MRKLTLQRWTAAVTVTLTVALALTTPGALPAQNASSQSPPPQTPASQSAPSHSPPDWRFADPGASLIGGLGAQALLQSWLIKSALDQARVKFRVSAPAMDLAMGALGGVSQIGFSLSVRHENPELLVLVKGNLSDATAEAFLRGANLAGAKAAVAPGKRSEPSPTEMRRVDADTILFGDVALIDAAVRRLRLPASTSVNPLVARAKTLAEGNDLWIGGTLPDIPAAAVLGGTIRELALGVSLQQEFRLQVSLNMATEALAQQLAARAKRSAETAQRRNNIDAKQEIEVEGATLRMKVSLDGEQLVKLVSEQMTGGVTGPGSFFSAGTTSPQTVQPAPSEHRKSSSIKIYGLDDGPREIPVSQ